jgi:hypothetical protein
MSRVKSQMYYLCQKNFSETIRICKDKNVLKEYLESKEAEVMAAV